MDPDENDESGVCYDDDTSAGHSHEGGEYSAEEYDHDYANSGEYDHSAGADQGMVAGDHPTHHSLGTEGVSATLAHGAHPVTSGEHSPTVMIGGLPTFVYNTPAVPIAETHIDTPEVSFDLSLTLTGSLTVAFAHAAPGLSYDMNQHAFELGATTAVDGVFQGVSVTGIGSSEPGISTTVGTEFVQTGVNFIPFNTMVFSGQAHVSTTRDTPAGTATVTGQPGYELRVTVLAHPHAPQPEPEDEESWFSRHSGALAAIGAAALAVAAVALAPETGGGSLLILAAG